MGSQAEESQRGALLQARHDVVRAPIPKVTPLPILQARCVTCCPMTPSHFAVISALMAPTHPCAYPEGWRNTGLIRCLQLHRRLTAGSRSYRRTADDMAVRCRAR